MPLQDLVFPSEAMIRVFWVAWRILVSSRLEVRRYSPYQEAKEVKENSVSVKLTRVAYDG